MYFLKPSSFNAVSVWEVETYSPTLSAKIHVPRAGEYMFAARLAGQNNTALMFEMGNYSAIIPFDGSYDGFRWYEIGPINLDSEEWVINISWKGSVQLDEFIIYSLKNGEERHVSDLFESSSSSMVTYQQINPTLYNIQVNCLQPSVLVFSDTYNSLWKAYLDSQELPQVSAAYSLVNGFFINRTGEFNVTIQFAGQTYADLGLRLSAATLFIAIAILVIPSKVFKLLRKYIGQRIRGQR